MVFVKLIKCAFLWLYFLMNLLECLELIAALGCV